MTDLSIIMHETSVRGLLALRKTQTRRVVGRLRRFGRVTEFGRSTTAGYDWHFRDKGALWNDLHHDRLLEVLPYAVGDSLWIRETWGSLEADHPRCKDGRKPQPGDRIVYAADPESAAQWGSGLPSQGSFCWRSSIHMPRWASRITMTVIDVRVQRLREISEADAEAEGAPQCARAVVGLPPGCKSFVCGYEQIWRMVNGPPFKKGEWKPWTGPGSWRANPWVAAYTFTVELGNIDKLSKEQST